MLWAVAAVATLLLLASWVVAGHPEAPPPGYVRCHQCGCFFLTPPVPRGHETRVCVSCRE